MADKIKHVVKFSRGDTFKVDVLIKPNDDMVFHNMSTPPATTTAVLEQFLHDAEVAAIAFLFSLEEKKNAAN